MTIEEILAGKIIVSHSNRYLATKDYVQPFLDKFPDVLWFDVKEITQDTFSRVSIISKHKKIDAEFDEIIGFSYSIDSRIPMAKFYSALRDIEGKLYIDPTTRTLSEQRIEAGKPLDTSILESFTFGGNKKIITKLKNLPFDCSEDLAIDTFLGRTIRLANNEEFPSKISKIKFATSDVLAAYKLLFTNNDSKFYQPVNMKTVYDAFAYVIANNTKDITNRYEKSWIVGRILEIW